MANLENIVSIFGFVLKISLQKGAPLRWSVAPTKALFTLHPGLRQPSVRQIKFKTALLPFPMGIMSHGNSHPFPISRRSRAHMTFGLVAQRKATWSYSIQIASMEAALWTLNT